MKSSAWITFLILATSTAVLVSCQSAPLKSLAQAPYQTETWASCRMAANGMTMVEIYFWNRGAEVLTIPLTALKLVNLDDNQTSLSLGSVSLNFKSANGVQDFRKLDPRLPLGTVKPIVTLKTNDAVDIEFQVGAEEKSFAKAAVDLTVADQTENSYQDLAICKH